MLAVLPRSKGGSVGVGVGEGMRVGEGVGVRVGGGDAVGVGEAVGRVVGVGGEAVGKEVHAARRRVKRRRGDKEKRRKGEEERRISLISEAMKNRGCEILEVRECCLFYIKVLLQVHG